MTQKLPIMLERIQRCRFCGREIAAPALSYEENPYCTECLGERLAQGGAAEGYVSWTVSGDYLRPIDLSQQRLQ
jgi:uncharacterized paraquat-inducible protein A